MPKETLRSIKRITKLLIKKNEFKDFKQNFCSCSTRKKNTFGWHKNGPCRVAGFLRNKNINTTLLFSQWLFWCQTISEGKRLDAVGLRLVQLPVLHGCETCLKCTAKFSEKPLEMVYGREIHIQFMGNSSGGCSCTPTALSLTICDVCCIVQCDKTAHFIVGSPRHTFFGPFF